MTAEDEGVLRSYRACTAEVALSALDAKILAAARARAARVGRLKRLAPLFGLATVALLLSVGTWLHGSAGAPAATGYGALEGATRGYLLQSADDEAQPAFTRGTAR